MEVGVPIPPLAGLATYKEAAAIGYGVEEGARLVAGGKAPQDPTLSKGFFIEPTVIAGLDNGARVAREEIFGPVLSVVRFHTVDEAFAINNDVKYGLSSSVYTQDVNVAMRAMYQRRGGLREGSQCLFCGSQRM